MERLPYDLCKPTYDLIELKPHSPEQAAPLMNQDRFPAICGGERGGKSWTTAAILLPHILALPYRRQERFFTAEGRLRFNPATDKPRNPDCLLFGPTYSQPRIEFEILEKWLQRLGKVVARSTSKPSDGQWRMVSTDGVVISTWSMEDPDSIRAVDLEFAAVCEAGWAPWAGIERVQGRIAAKRGFCVYSGTLEESQQWWKDWLIIGKRPNNMGIVSYLIPTWSNIVEFPGGRNDPEIKRLEAFHTEDIFMSRFGAEPRPPRYRVLKEATEECVQRVDIPDDALHEIWIDPGYASAYAVLFVAMWTDKFGIRRFHCYDELYEQNLNTVDMIELCKKKPSWPKISTGVIDIASKGHRDATESSLEIWEKRTSITFGKRYWAEDRLIERTRSCFKVGQLTIDPACRGLLAECGIGDPVFPEMHPWRYATDRDGRIIGEKPIDRWNHSAKALGYGLLKHLGQVESKRSPTTWNRLRRK